MTGTAGAALCSHHTHAAEHSHIHTAAHTPSKATCISLLEHEHHMPQLLASKTRRYSLPNICELYVCWELVHIIVILKENDTPNTINLLNYKDTLTKILWNNNTHTTSHNKAYY